MYAEKDREKALQLYKSCLSVSEVIRTDRSSHCRWPGWISRMNSAGLQRSISKRGCSPDNSACKGFFGRLKNEMFYNRSWPGVSTERFIQILNEYFIWYNETRIKTSLQNMSPLEYRLSKHQLLCFLFSSYWPVFSSVLI